MLPLLQSTCAGTSKIAMANAPPHPFNASATIPTEWLQPAVGGTRRAAATPVTPADFGWIVLRNVPHAATDDLNRAFILLWLEGCRRLRRWFPNDPILIIDNRSNRSVFPLNWTCPDWLQPCTVEMHDRSTAAELLPYLVRASTTHRVHLSK